MMNVYIYTFKTKEGNYTVAPATSEYTALQALKKGNVILPPSAILQVNMVLLYNITID